MSTHYARHTFCTELSRLGYSKESRALQSGHKNLDSLDRYEHKTTEEKIDKLIKETDEIFNRNKENPIEIIDSNKNIIKENKEVLLMLGANPYKVWEMNNADEIRKLLSEYEHRIMLEIDSMELDPIKDIFNEKISLEDRIDKINLLKSKRKQLARKEYKQI